MFSSLIEHEWCKHGDYADDCAECNDYDIDKCLNCGHYLLSVKLNANQCCIKGCVNPNEY